MLLAFASIPSMAAAQLEDAGPFIWRADLTGVTQYYWRGIRRNDHFALQPDVALGYASNGYSFSAGGRGSGDAELGDFFEEYFDEVNAWGQAAVRRGGFTAAVGVMSSWYRSQGTATARVTEPYGWLRYQSGRWSMAVQAWTAVDGAAGTYVEPTITRYHIANPFHGPGLSLSSRLRTGFQLGERDPESPLVPGPAGTGLTFVELAMTFRAALDLGPLTMVTSVGPALRYNRDPVTRLQPDGGSDKVHFSVPLQVGFAFPGRNRQ